MKKRAIVLAKVLGLALIGYLLLLFMQFLQEKLKALFTGNSKSGQLQALTSLAGITQLSSVSNSPEKIIKAELNKKPVHISNVEIPYSTTTARLIVPYNATFALFQNMGADIRFTYSADPIFGDIQAGFLQNDGDSFTIEGNDLLNKFNFKGLGTGKLTVAFFTKE